MSYSVPSAAVWVIKMGLLQLYRAGHVSDGTLLGAFGVANNRIHLKCLPCNQALLIAKYTPGSGWYRKEMLQVGGIPVPFVVALDGFLEKHSECSKKDGNGITMYGNHITIVQEVPPE